MSRLIQRVLIVGALSMLSDASHADRSLITSLDTNVKAGMERTQTQGIAVAVIENGKVKLVKSWGRRNAKGEPLTPDTVMYGASLTKAVLAYTVMQLVEEGRLDLDTSIAQYLPKPLPEYADEEEKYAAWQHLGGDERWRKLTPRILLTHSSGFSNFGFLEPDGKLKFHFDPGTRYAYSGDGLILLQFVIERGLGLDLGQEMQRRVFDRFGMKNTSMIWRADFATFAAGYVSGAGLKKGSRNAQTAAQLPITIVSQFPSLQAEAPTADQFKGLAAGLGVVTFTGPKGRGFFKGGHNDSTGNMWVCVEKRRACVVILSNDVRAEPMFPSIVKLVLGETGMPWAWEYGALNWTIE